MCSKIQITHYLYISKLLIAIDILFCYILEFVNIL